MTGNSVSGIPDGNDNLAGGGIYNRNGLTLNISNSIVANNTAPASPDIFGPLNSGDFNLIKDTSGIVGPLPGSHNITGQDPRLAPLGDYGGPTKTHALLPDSPALDVLPNQTDQRGVIRPKGNGTDIGSFEISISISPSSLADAKQGALYSQLLSATDCSGVCAFDLIDGSLPSGLSLSSDGVISGVPAETGAFSFTVSAKDSTGVAGVRQYAFNVLSADEPSIVCPANITVSNDSGECSASVSFTVNSAGDPAPTVECRVNGAIITSPYTFSIGTTEVNCMATNAGGRAACSFNVTVNDTQSPSIICQSNQVVVESPSGSGQAVVNYPEPEASDNCAVASLVCSPASGSVFPLGTTTVTCTGTDTSGNTANCSFSVTVTASLDICLEDDSVAANELRFNSITGDYLFCCGSMTVAGRGKVSKKGCTITLTDNSTGRRVNATVDTCQSRGSATLQSPPGSMLCTITDRDIRNNSCSCSGS